MNNRLSSFDLIKLFTIYLVLIGHCIQYFLSSNFTDAPIYRIIYTFHMPLFMMISGYFSVSSMNVDIKSFFRKKTINLILPCISWSIIWWTSYSIIKSQEMNYFVNKVINSLLNDFWFLKSCFLCYCITYIGKKTKLKDVIWIPVAIIFSFTLPYQVNLMYPAFITGYLLRVNTSFSEHINKKYYIFSVIFIIMLFFINKSYWTFPGILSSIYEHNYLSLIKSLYLRLYRIIIGIAGSITFIFLFKTLSDHCRNTKIIDRIANLGKYTLEVYILQSFILERILGNLLNFDNQSFFIFNFITAPIISLIILIISVYIAKLLHKNKMLSFILFGKTYRKLVNN